MYLATVAHTKAAAELEAAAATQAILALTRGQIAAKLTPRSSQLAVRGLRRGRRLPRVRHRAAIAGGGRLVSRTLILCCASAIRRRRLIRIRIRIRRSLVHLLLRSIRRVSSMSLVVVLVLPSSARCGAAAAAGGGGRGGGRGRDSRQLIQAGCAASASHCAMQFKCTAAPQHIACLPVSAYLRSYERHALKEAVEAKTCAAT